MPLAVDSSALWAVIKGEEMSEEWLRFLNAAARRTHLVICDVVLAETAPFFDRLADLFQALEVIHIEYNPIEPESAFLAGQIFARYRKGGGRRTALIPDFLIGAHAIKQTDGLLTADRGYLRTYFADLKIHQPQKS